MPQTSTTSLGSIGRRIDSTLAAIVTGKHEEALIHLFPAMDKTAKRRRPNVGVAERIRRFIDDQQIIITSIAFGNILTKDCLLDGLSFSQAIYKFGRTSIAHEGELDENLLITSGNQVRIGKTWELPASTIFSMCVAVMIAPENSSEKSLSEGTVNVLGQEFSIQELWGAQSKIENMIRQQYRRDVHVGI